MGAAQWIRAGRGGRRCLFRWTSLRRGRAVHQECRRSEGVLAGTDRRLGFRGRGRIRTGLRGNATGLWATSHANFGYWKPSQQRHASGFEAFRREKAEIPRQTVCPFPKEATHPRCCGEGYLDWPGRASNKEGESWTSIAGLSSESIRRSCAMLLRSRKRVVVGTFAISARSTPRKQRRASSSPNLRPNTVN